MNDAASPTHNIKVLLVDDEKDQMTITSLVLTSIDPSLKIIVVENPKDALKYVTSGQSIDCVISDYQMPEMDGIHLCSEIRMSSSVPFIIYTGQGSEEVASQAFQAGADDYVKKEKENSHYEVLANRVKNVVDKWRAEEELRKSREELEIKIKERTSDLSHMNEQLQMEVEERKRTEQTLRLEEARLDALLHLSRMSEASLQEITGFTLEQAINLTTSKIGFVGFLNEDESVYTLHAVSKDVVKECMVTGDPLQWHVADAGIWAEAITERRTLFINDYSKPHRRKKGLPLGHPYVNRFMVVPILEEGKVVALAGVGNKTSDYDVSDERQVTLLLDGMWGYVERNLSRQRLQQAYEELEKRVRQRTAELSRVNRELRLANERLESLNEELVTSNDMLSKSEGELAAINEELQVSEDELRIKNDQLSTLNVELRDSEERFRATFQQAAVGIEMLSLDGRYLRGNSMLCKILGYTEEELLQLNFSQITDEDDLKLEQPLIEDLIKGKIDYYTIEKRYLRKTGESIWARVTSSIAKTKEPYRLSIIEDITERKRIREALVESEERFRVMADGSPSIIWVTDISGGIMFVNRTYREFFGVTYEEVKGGKWQPLLHPDDSPAYVTAFMDAVCEHKPFHAETRVLRADGEWRWIESHGEPRFSSSGEFLGHIGISSDITERKIAEEELRTSYAKLRRSEEELATINKELHASNIELIEAKELVNKYASRLEEMVDARTRDLTETRERLQAFMDSASEGFSIYDKDLNLIDANRVVVERFPTGTRKEGIIGRNIKELYPGIENSLWYTAYKKVLETGEPCHINGKRGIHHLSEVILDASAYKVGDGIGVISRDVTKIRQAEEKLHEARRLEAIDKLSAMVAHDIRSPLITASQALDMARKKPEKAEELYAMTERNISRAVDMIEELRENTRLIVPRKSDVNLGSLIKETIKGMYLPENVTIENILSDEIETVSIDSTMIRRVIENLIMNATDAMPEGGKVKVNASREGEDVLVTVTDTGIGISDDNADKIFTPLYTSKAKGVGLGLSYCKRVVEAHGGTITFTSKLGKGTTFTIKLPSKEP